MNKAAESSIGAVLKGSISETQYLAGNSSMCSDINLRGFLNLLPDSPLREKAWLGSHDSIRTTKSSYKPEELELLGKGFVLRYTNIKLIGGVSFKVTFWVGADIKFLFPRARIINKRQLDAVREYVDQLLGNDGTIL